MGALDGFRAQNPAYSSVPDATLADALYAKYYSSMPRADYDAKLGLAPQAAPFQFGQLPNSALAQPINVPRPMTEANGPSITSLVTGQAPKGEMQNPYSDEAIFQGLGIGGMEAAKGVPVLGAAVPQTQAMTEAETRHPWATAGLQVGGGVASLAPAMMAAPAWMGVTGGLGVRALASGASGAGISAADQAARQIAAPMTGQESPKPSAMLTALGLPSSQYEPVNAAVAGAAGNAVLTPAASVIGKALAPVMSGSGKLLANAGVKLSTGQAAGGVPNEIERLGTAFPLSGMSTMRAEALPSFNRGAENIALSHADIPEFKGLVATEVPKTIDPGSAGREFVHQEASKAYKFALEGAPGDPKPPTITLTPGDLTAAKDNAAALLPEGMKPETRAQFDSATRKLFTVRLEPTYTQGTDEPVFSLGGKGLSNALNELDDVAQRAIKRGGDGYDLGHALGGYRQEILDALKTQNPVASARLQAADKIWAHYAELRQAGSTTAAELHGQFSPAQLASGSKAADISFKKTATSEGRTRYGDYARAGIDVGIDASKPNLMSQLEAAGMVGGATYLNPYAAGAYPAMWIYSHPWMQALGRSYMQNASPAIRQALPVAAKAMALPQQQSVVRRALLGEQAQ